MSTAAALFIDGDYVSRQVHLPMNIQHMKMTEDNPACFLLHALARKCIAHDPSPLPTAVAAPLPPSYATNSNPTTISPPPSAIPFAELPKVFRLKVVCFSAFLDASAASSEEQQQQLITSETNRRLWMHLFASLGFHVFSTGSASATLATRAMYTAWKMPYVSTYCFVATSMDGGEWGLKQLRDNEGCNVHFVRLVPPSSSAAPSSPDDTTTWFSPGIVDCVGPAGGFPQAVNFSSFSTTTSTATAAEGMRQKASRYLSALASSAKGLNDDRIIPVGSSLQDVRDDDVIARNVSSGGSRQPGESQHHHHHDHHQNKNVGNNNNSSAADFIAGLGDLGRNINNNSSSNAITGLNFSSPPPIDSAPNPFEDWEEKKKIFQQQQQQQQQQEKEKEKEQAASIVTHNAVVSSTPPPETPDLSQFKEHLTTLGWQVFFDKASERPYYFHSHSKQTSWEHPGGATLQRDVDICIARWIMAKKQYAAVVGAATANSHVHVGDAESTKIASASGAAIGQNHQQDPIKQSTVTSVATTTTKTATKLSSVDSLFQKDENDGGLVVPVAPAAPSPQVYSATPAVPPSHNYAAIMHRNVNEVEQNTNNNNNNNQPPIATTATTITTRVVGGGGVANIAPAPNSNSANGLPNNNNAPSISSSSLPPQQTQQQLKPLPAGWEEATDPGSGAKFYIDHNAKITTWVRPT